MTFFSLRVNINPCEIPSLINSGYGLCVARKVGNDYTIVWKAIRKVCMTNVFHFSSDFQVFGQHSCRSGSPVSCTDSVPVCGGQKVLLESHGKFQSASGNMNKNAPILVSNQHVLTYLGMTCYDYESSSYLPMFVQKQPTFYGFSVCLLPTQTVKVWFQRDVSSSTIITTTENSMKWTLAMDPKQSLFWVLIFGTRDLASRSALTIPLQSRSSQPRLCRPQL